MMPQINNRLHDRRVFRVSTQMAYKRLVDLEFVDGKTLEVSQTGIAGAEIVDGQRQSASAQILEQFDGAFNVAHDDTLSDFQFNEGRINHALCESIGDATQE